MASEVNPLQCYALKSADGYICTVQINTDTAKKTELGTSFTTDEFALDFPESGVSSWVMQIFPNGQYGAGGRSNGHLSAYLKLISVENESKSLFLDIEFKVILINGFQLRRTMKTNLQAVDYCFNWSRKSTRWYGGSLVKLDDLFGSVQIEFHLKRKYPNIGKQNECIPNKTVEYNSTNISPDHIQDTTNNAAPADEPPMKKEIIKSPDIKKPIPETPSYSFRSSDIRYRNQLVQNLQEISKKAPTVNSQKKDDTGPVAKNIKKFDEMLKENTNTENEDDPEMAKIKQTENLQKDQKKNAKPGQSSDEVATVGPDQQQLLNQSGVVSRFVAYFVKTIFNR